MAKDIMKTQACIIGIITADENDVKQLQLHTHTRCKQSQHASSGLMIRGWLAWGSTNTQGRSGKRFAGNSSLSEGLFTGKGKMVIFIV